MNYKPLSAPMLQLYMLSILITHDLHIAEQMTDKLYVMQQGRIIETLKPYDTPQHAYTQTLFDACHALHFA